MTDEKVPFMNMKGTFFMPICYNFKLSGQSL